MPTSLEKARAYVEQIADANDEQLAILAPGLPPMLARPMAAMLPRMLPDTVEELDQMLNRANEFIASLRSDPEPA